MKLITMLLLLFFSLCSTAQNRFASFTTVGIVAGENLPALELQTVNGLRHHRFFVGAGIGKDDYFYKSMPLFADGRVFISNNQDIFVYGDLGYNFALKNKAKEDYYEVNDFGGGVYTGFGLGVTAKLKGKSRFLFTGGHTQKTMKLYQSLRTDCPGCSLPEFHSKLTFNRIVLKAGIAL